MKKKKKERIRYCKTIERKCLLGYNIRKLGHIYDIAHRFVALLDRVIRIDSGEKPMPGCQKYVTVPAENRFDIDEEKMGNFCHPCCDFHVINR
jgi:hypothetical protein